MVYYNMYGHNLKILLNLHKLNGCNVVFIFLMNISFIELCFRKLKWGQHHVLQRN